MKSDMGQCYEYKRAGTDRKSQIKHALQTGYNYFYITYIRVRVV